MAQTHQQVVKVWIAPGCIVCDSCETDCPEVFDVQEETCVIRPDALNAEFTKPLTPSIIEAAEGCPVDVIKFETIEVEGPEPWAGQEQEQAAEAAGGATATVTKKKSAAAIPEGPPDPKWAKLLSTAYTSGSRSAGGPAVTMRPSAKAPAEAITGALPKQAPPDAMAAAMVGSGFTRPAPSIPDRIRSKAGILTSAAKVTRRQFNLTVAAAWSALAFTGALAAGALQSFMVPKVIIEPPTSFRVGRLSDYAEPGVYEDFKSDGFWLIHLADGRLVALSTICTHLGCIPNWMPADLKFKCPCHGSGFYITGVNFEGPASRPLERLKISIEGDYVVVDKAFKFRQELGQWDQADSYLNV